MKRLLAILLVAVMALSLFACGGKTDKNDETGNKDNGNATESVSLAGKKYGVELEDGKYDGDYISLYKKYGDDVTIADVTEDPETGFATCADTFVTRSALTSKRRLSRVKLQPVRKADLPTVKSA